MNKQIQREKKALKKIESDLQKKRQKNVVTKKKERSILADLEVLDRRFRLFRKEARLLELEIEKKERKAQDLSRRIKELTREIEKAKKIVLARLSSIYKKRQSASLKILFASQDYPEFFRKLHYLKTIAQKEEAAFSLFKERYAELEENQDRSKQVVERMIEDRETLARKLVESRSERKKKDRLLIRVRRDKKLFKKAISEMTRSSQKVQRLITTLEQKKKQLETTASKRFSREKGRLRWPSDGKVAALFGRQKHPKFDAMIYRKGIEIAPARGGEVRTVFGGTVVYADWFRGYGMMVMIDHGENYYSLYAHLEKVLVGVGDQVKKDRTIGAVGGTGLSHGPKLYFEIRHQGEPINPLSWLQKRR